MLYLEGIDYEVIDFTKPLATKICEVLHGHSINSVLIEGGSQTLEAFIQENLWDEARVFTGASHFGTGIKAPELSGKPMELITILSDTLATYTND